MNAPTPFTFGIPLIARKTARDWPRVETLLELTLASVLSQSTDGYRILVAGHDRPGVIPDDPRIHFLQADWPAEGPEPNNMDSGRKKYIINEEVLAAGGGLLMFLDADDWVDRRLVETAREILGREHVGGIIEAGLATDFITLRSAPIPHPRLFDGPFQRICGSSTVLQVAPDAGDTLHRDPYSLLHEHYRWPELAEHYGGRVARLPVCGNYLINTSENHSEIHGPYADWRQRFTEQVNGAGTPLDAKVAARFGLGLGQIHAASLRCGASAGAFG